MSSAQQRAEDEQSSSSAVDLNAQVETLPVMKIFTSVK